MSQLNQELQRKWHDASNFPTPGMFLLVRLLNGKEVVAIRPDYVRSYNHDPQYKTPEGAPLQGVRQWSIL
jgi:hypothetical protein